MTFEFLVNEEIHSTLVRGHMLAAERTLWIASANLKDMHVEHRRRYRSVLKSFAEMAKKGVDVRILHSAVPSESYLKSLKECGLIARERFTMRRCPRSHLKTVIIDSRCVFIGSANLTGAGMGAKSPDRRNFEIGILSRDVVTVDAVADLFDTIWEGRMCDACGRRRHCPVPLEEPNF